MKLPADGQERARRGDTRAKTYDSIFVAFSQKYGSLAEVDED